MPIVQRYSDTIKGSLIYTGNTLGFSYNVANTYVDIGAYLAVDPTLSAAGYPTPSTFRWDQNGSTAQLNIPANSSVVYAEVIWGGSTLGTATPAISTTVPITFITPLTTTLVTSDTITALSSVGSSQTFYTCSKNVTSLVNSAGSGTYTVKGVPGTIETGTFAYNQTGCCGWVLAVVYSNNTLPYRSITMYVSSIGTYAGNIDTTFTGFLTPLSGSFSTRVVISAMEGNAGLTEDFIQLGPNIVSLTTLVGPNNPVNNFFCSQINNSTGLLDTTGSFGTLNQPLPTGIYGVTRVRNAWDITNVSGGSALGNGINQAVLRFGSVQDSYAVSTFGLEVDVNQANLSPINKSVNKLISYVGDTLTYTLNFTNTGSDNAYNVVVLDTIPTGTNFIPNSVMINGVGDSSNPQTGINLGTIPSGQVNTITFQVQVDTVPAGTTISNTAITDYSFVIGSNTINTGVISNVVTTTILGRAQIGMTKTATPSYVKLGDTLTYTIELNNTGSTTADNLFFSDTIPLGTTFANNITVNGVTVPGANPNPPSSIPVGNIDSGSTTTISFNVIVVTLPTSGTIPNDSTVNFTFTEDPSLPNGAIGSGNSNKVETPATQAIINNINGILQKTVDKSFATVGDILTYTIALGNGGNTAATSVVFTDTMPNGTTYVPGSATLNGTPVSGILTTGIQVGTIPSGSVSTISFKVTVNNTIPSPNPIPNDSTIIFNYTSQPSLPNGSSGSGNSNTVNTQINIANLGNVTKAVDKSYAECGNILIYTITIPNTGNMTATNVILIDTVPNGTTYVTGSLEVDGNPIGGTPASINIGTIPAGSISTVSFKVQINC
ncbi:hypothetical protein [Romboutsia sp.]|uniref:hypothetical protein n=1 Tax=Romboutsia sp. TaxID=1965302 RepID=UPI003F3FD807